MSSLRLSYMCYSGANARSTRDTDKSPLDMKYPPKEPMSAKYENTRRERPYMSQAIHLFE